jgi:hypothetical protein
MATYVYGITREDLPPPVIDDGKETEAGQIRLIRAAGLAAIVGPSPGDDIPARTAAVRLHAKVLAAAVHAGPVLPLRFGAVFHGDSEVAEELLERNASRWDSLLERVGNKVEVSLTIAFRQDPLLQRILDEDPRLAAEHRRISGLDPTAAHFEKVEFGRTLMQRVEAFAQAERTALFSAIAPQCDDVRAREPRSAYVAVDLACLLSRARMDEFDQTLDSIALDRPDLEVKAVGPLPPYSFVDIEPTSAEGL